MTYTRAIHDTTHYSKRLVDALQLDRDSHRLVAGVDSFFLENPRQYPWNDKDVGCLPMISHGGKVLVRLIVQTDVVRVDFSMVEGAGGSALLRRAENALAHAITRHDLRPYQAKAGGYGTNPGQGWTIYATDDPQPQRHRQWFWYNLAAPPKALAS